MAPFYSICSILSIMFYYLSPYITLIRDSYEAFLLFVFFYLIFSYLAYDDSTGQISEDKLYRIMVD